MKIPPRHWPLAVVLFVTLNARHIPKARWTVAALFGIDAAWAALSGWWWTAAGCAAGIALGVWCTYVIEAAVGQTYEVLREMREGR